MRARKSEAAAQEPPDRERDARDTEERSDQGGDQHDRNDRQKSERKAQERYRRQRQEDHHEPRAESDLCTVPVLEAFDRASCTPRKDDETGQREKRQPGAAAEEGAHGLVWVERSEAADRRVEDEFLADA